MRIAATTMSQIDEEEELEEVEEEMPDGMDIAAICAKARGALKDEKLSSGMSLAEAAAFEATGRLAQPHSETHCTTHMAERAVASASDHRGRRQGAPAMESRRASRRRDSRRGNIA